jgi:hypothetical protein
VVRINIEIVFLRLETVSGLPSTSTTDTVAIPDEIDFTLGDFQNQNHVIANTQRSLDTVSLADRLDDGGDFRLHFLIHVSHFAAPLLLTTKEL